MRALTWLQSLAYRHPHRLEGLEYIDPNEQYLFVATNHENMGDWAFFLPKLSSHQGEIVRWATQASFFHQKGMTWSLMEHLAWHLHLVCLYKGAPTLKESMKDFIGAMNAGHNVGIYLPGRAHLGQKWARWGAAEALLSTEHPPKVVAVHFKNIPTIGKSIPIISPFWDWAALKRLGWSILQCLSLFKIQPSESYLNSLPVVRFSKPFQMATEYHSPVDREKIEKGDKPQSEPINFQAAYQAAVTAGDPKQHREVLSYAAHAMAEECFYLAGKEYDEADAKRLTKFKDDQNEAVYKRKRKKWEAAIARWENEIDALERFTQPLEDTGVISREIKPFHFPGAILSFICKRLALDFTDLKWAQAALFKGLRNSFSPSKSRSKDQDPFERALQKWQDILALASGTASRKLLKQAPGNQRELLFHRMGEILGLYFQAWHILHVINHLSADKKPTKATKSKDPFFSRFLTKGQPFDLLRKMPEPTPLFYPPSATLGDCFRGLWKETFSVRLLTEAAYRQIERKHEDAIPHDCIKIEGQARYLLMNTQDANEATFHNAVPVFYKHMEALLRWMLVRIKQTAYPKGISFDFRKDLARHQYRPPTSES